MAYSLFNNNRIGLTSGFNAPSLEAPALGSNQVIRKVTNVSTAVSGTPDIPQPSKPLPISALVTANLPPSTVVEWEDPCPPGTKPGRRLQQFFFTDEYGDWYEFSVFDCIPVAEGGGGRGGGTGGSGTGGVINLEEGAGGINLGGATGYVPGGGTARGPSGGTGGTGGGSGGSGGSSTGEPLQGARGGGIGIVSDMSKHIFTSARSANINYITVQKNNDKETYPLPIEDFKKETTDPPEFDFEFEPCQTAGQYADCCSEEMKQTIKDAYNKLFVDKENSPLNKFPPKVYDCLLKAMQEIEVFKCLPSWHENSSKREDGVTPLDVSGNRVPDPMNPGVSVLNMNQHSALSSDLALQSILYAIWGRTDDVCSDVKYLGSFDDFVGLLPHYYSSPDQTTLCDDIKGSNSKSRWVLSGSRLVIVDKKTGRVFANPFWPHFPPEDWKPKIKNFIYRNPYIANC